VREVTFIKINAPRWEKLELLLKSNTGIHPDELSDLYINLQDDLAYARTFYPKSNTTKYLNELTAGYHRVIYKNKRERSNRFVTFWKYEIPYAVLKSHRQMLYALLVFLLAIVIGTISAANDSGFTRLILGDSYVNMTLENIKNDDPMGVYGKIHEQEMFFAISTNNIRVSFITYVLGLFGSIGSIYMLFTNGLMVGVFQQFFYNQGLTFTALSAIYLHGALELSAIVIAGGAGIVLGNSFLFPGTYSRTESVMEGAKRSLKIIIGVVPVFVVAAIIESFVTRHYNTMPAELRLSVIFISFTFIVTYFIVYPLYLKNTNHAKQHSTA
jgi:uncharacterized membrane protein SpoIIM required for sporulation